MLTLNIASNRDYFFPACKRGLVAISNTLVSGSASRNFYALCSDRVVPTQDLVFRSEAMLAALMGADFRSVRVG